MPGLNHTSHASPARPLAIKSSRAGASVTIALSGELDLASVEDLDRAIRNCEETDIGWIVIDLSDVSFIDSTGLNVLLDARKRINGRLRFVRSKHEAVTRLLAMTHADEILN